MTKSERSEEIFASGFNCAQSIFMTFCKEFSIDEKTAASVTAGFGGGMGNKQLTCGAVTGAICVLGCLYFDPDDVRGSKKRTYEKTNEFLSEFERRHGHTSCRALLGVDLSTDEGYQAARERGLFATTCASLVKSACEMLEEYGTST